MSTKYIIDNLDGLLTGQTINGDLTITSAITASTYYGDGSNLTGVVASFTGNTSGDPINELHVCNVVGLLGQIRVLKNQEIPDRWIKMEDVDDNIALYLVR